jgi:hypothetical protein
MSNDEGRTESKIRITKEKMEALVSGLSGFGFRHSFVIRHFLAAVIIGKSSVRKGDAGSPALFHKFTTGKSAQP